MRLIFSHLLRLHSRNIIVINGSHFKASTRLRGWHLRRRGGSRNCCLFSPSIWYRVRVDEVKNHRTNWSSLWWWKQQHFRQSSYHRDVVMTLWIGNLIYSWSISFSFPARKTVSSKRERKKRWSDMKIGSFISSCNSIFYADDSRWWSERKNCLKLQQHVFAVSFCPHESDNILITNFFVSISLHLPNDPESNANEAWQRRKGGEKLLRII